MTLTDFINAYVYMPLLRLRESFSFYYVLFVTVVAMSVVGFWHGASWNYLLFGFMQGIALVVNHLWRRHSFIFYKPVAWLLTMLWWHLTLVVFRSSTLDAAWQMYISMFNGSFHWISKGLYETFPALVFLPVEILTFVMFALFGFLFACCLKLKNPHEHYNLFKPTPLYFALTLACLVSSILLMNHVTEFIYFQF